MKSFNVVDKVKHAYIILYDVQYYIIYCTISHHTRSGQARPGLGYIAPYKAIQ